MTFTSQNMTILQSHRQTQVAIDMRMQITAEAVAGIWTAEEARAKIMALAGDDHPPAPKRHKSARTPSPDWDSDFDASEEEI